MDLIRESSLIQYFKREGREESFEQGKRKSTLEAIRNVLEIRFGLTETHPISDRIAAVDNV